MQVCQRQSYTLERPTDEGAVCCMCGAVLYPFKINLFGAHKTINPRPPCGQCQEKAEGAKLERERRKMAQVRREEIVGFLCRAGVSKRHANQYKTIIWPEMDPVTKGFLEGTNEKKGLFITGKNGTGKTSLAVRACAYLILRLHSPTFITLTGLFCKLQEAINDPYNSEARVLKEYSHANWLFLDDIGAKRGTDYVNEKMFELLDYRLTNDLPTCFTSDLDLDQLEKHFEIAKSEGSGRRLTERILEMCEISNLSGSSWRRSTPRPSTPAKKSFGAYQADD